jgi:hypothetical protein
MADHRWLLKECSAVEWKRLSDFLMPPAEDVKDRKYEQEEDCTTNCAANNQCS